MEVFEPDDQARDPNGTARHQHGAVRHGGSGRSSVETPPFPRDKEAHLDGSVRFAERELERLSRLLGDDRRGLIATLAQRERELAHDLPTFHQVLAAH